jgi:hypothetical protein
VNARPCEHSWSSWRLQSTWRPRPGADEAAESAWVRECEVCGGFDYLPMAPGARPTDEAVTHGWFIPPP